jgi:hypothetical protein
VARRGRGHTARLAAALVGTFAAGLALGACNRSAPGWARVEGTFFVEDCTRGEDVRFDAFAYDAGYLATRRFEDSLSIQLFRSQVRVEETDGLTIQLASVDAVRAFPAPTPERPLLLPIGPHQSTARAILSLYTTCPRRPTLAVRTGTLALTRALLTSDPLDSGDEEHLTGTLTASVVGADDAVVVGSLRASFDFEPVSSRVIAR